MTDNITPMPGVQLPAQAAAQEQAAQDQLEKLVTELLTLVKQGQITWIAIAGEFDNGAKMSAFGNIGKGDPQRVVGSIEWLKAEYMSAVAMAPPR